MQTIITSYLGPVLFKFVKSFEILTKVDHHAEIVRFSQMTSEYIHEEISRLFCSEKFYGWVVVVSTNFEGQSLGQDLET